MPKYKITYKKQRICEDVTVVVIDAKTKKEAEETVKSHSKEELEKEFGSVEVYKNKLSETDWKASVSKGD